MKSEVEILYEILDYIRIDGPIDAPLVILSIEDGGNHDHISSANDIFDSFKADAKKFENGNFYLSQWISESGEIKSVREEIGVIGGSICKIISYLKTGSFTNYESQKNLIYTNESPVMNIKFYPLGKPNVTWNAWEEGLGKIFNIPLHIYKYLSQGKIRELHQELLRKKINDGAYFIIAGNWDEWAPLLLNVFQREKGRLFSRSENPEGTRLTVYFDSNDKVMFFTTPMINTYVSDREVELMYEFGLKNLDV